MHSIGVIGILNPPPPTPVFVEVAHLLPTNVAYIIKNIFLDIFKKAI